MVWRVAFERVLHLSNDPERAAGRSAAAGLAQDDGKIPGFLAAGIAGRVGNEDLFVLHTAQDNEVAGRGEVSFCHQRHYQLSIGQCIQDPLRLGCGAACNR